MTTGTRRLSLILILVLVPGLLGALPSKAADADHLTNLEHLDFLADRVDPPEQDGHTTYGLDTDPEIGVLWTYAEPRDGGAYERIGGGTYDPETDTYGQGAFNADDISRAAVVYIRHWRQFGDDHSREMARELLRGLTYLQTAEGDDAGNVVLWMQPDGTLNPSAEPIELPDPSDSDASYWLARTIWALGEGYAAFAETDQDFAAFLRERLDLAIAAVDRQVLQPEYGQTVTVDGLEWPAWLIAEGADASSEAVYGLVAYVAAAEDDIAERVLRQLAEGIALMQLGDARQWPFGALMPWTGSRSVWHAWGDQMAGALASAGDVLDEEAWIDGAVAETATFTPHLLIQNGPENGWLPAPADRTQIAYGADATLHNLLETYEATGREAFLETAGIAAAWYFGNNPAGVQMYDPDTGRTFDGINGDGVVNQNSGAESTIHGLLSMLALDRYPDVAARARIADRADQVTWQLVEAEDGTLANASVVEPEALWTGESQFTGVGYVELGPDASTTLSVDLPTRDSYSVFPVFWRQQDADAVTTQRLDGHVAGMQFHGGAGAAGATPEPGFLDVGSGSTRAVIGAGEQDLIIAHTSGGDSAQVDAVLVQPDLEWLLLRSDGDAQALLRSFDDHRRVKRIHLPGERLAIARSYDQQGVLVGTRFGVRGRVTAVVVPGGFTVVSGE